MQHARGFAVDYSETHPILSIYGSADTTRYVLLPANTSSSEKFSPGLVPIRTPVQRLVVTSTTHLGLVELLDARDCLVGIGQADFVYDADIRRRAAQGQIQEVAVGGTLNIELVLALQPDLVMVSANPGGVASYQPLLEAGIPVVVNAEWQEASPLGKAEWVKLLAVLLGRESVANERFGTIAATYDSLTRQLPATAPVPLVITGSPFQGAWYVPGRNSYVGQLLRDARVTWAGEHDSSSEISFNMSLETLYSYGLRADYWINPGMYTQRRELGETDERITAFRPYRRGEVYGHNRRVSDAGGDDYYESGAVRPDLVLADLIEIFHPDVLNHSLYYYQKLE